MRPYYRFMRFLSQAAFVAYFRGRVFGLQHVPQTGPVVLASNHQSYFDPISATMALHRDGNYMARDSLFRNPLFGRLIASLNAFPVKRGAADVGAVKEILRRLQQGKVVLVFPEATRTRDGSIGRINPNVMAIAKRAGAVVVPTIVDGAFEAWPRTNLLPRPRRTYVTYAEPVTAEQVRDWPPGKIAEEVGRRLRATLEASLRRRRRAQGDGWFGVSQE